MTRSLCKKSNQKFVLEMPKVRNVTIQFEKMDTSTSAVLVEWDVSKYLKMSPSIWDRFEVQVRVKNEWAKYLTRTLNKNDMHWKIDISLGVIL